MSWTIRLTITLVLGVLFLAMLFIVSKLPYSNESTQATILAAVFAGVAYLMTQVQRDRSHYMALRAGVMAELLRLDERAKANHCPLNHNFQALFYPHLLLFPPKAVFKITRLISDIDLLNTSRANGREDCTAPSFTDIVKGIDEALHEIV